ncbi:UPF0187 protein [Symbiodinium microadriaticum]|uniref:UPF0187 protein n=1 Tax=Symbiodinium microadriaticum TaxID=2951 RepID=A0A1Q9E4D0_SYMMI|nr:UPF0187 protein [Symbiodinium microadriaticum]
MVVVYDSGAEGSTWSFFTITPFLLFKVRGSIVPSLVPQLLLMEGLSVLAVYVADEDPSFGEAARMANGAVPDLAALRCSQEQEANKQFWEAISDLTMMCHLLRSISMTICGMVTWEVDAEVQVHAKRVIRLLALYSLAVREFFQRTGKNATTSSEQMDRLRQDVAALAGDTEWSILYPGDHKSVSGSASPHDTTRPSIILFWVTLSLRKIMDHNATEAPIMNGLLTQLAAVGSCFWNMDKIDKTQFPFPYCFFGLDEVAEILESPFGNDPNDLDLREYCDALMSDMELICQCRELKLDFVLKENEKVDFSHLLANFDKQKQFHQHFKRQSVALAQSGEFSRAQSDGFSRDSQSQEEAGSPGPQKDEGIRGEALDSVMPGAVHRG